MKSYFLVLCLAVASCTALPTQTQHASVLDLLGNLEDMVHENGRILVEKMINVIHVVESGVEQVRDMIPSSYDRFHQEVEGLLEHIHKVTEEVRELLGKQKAQFGFDLLSGLTELSGGTKLSTVMSVISLADKTHRVMDDAKNFVPHLNQTLDRIQQKIQSHVQDFAKQVLRDLGLQDFLKQEASVQGSVLDKLEDLINTVEDEGHQLILDLVKKMQLALDLLKYSLPDEHEKVEKAVKDIQAKINDLVEEIKKSLAMKSFSILDIAGDATSGTQLSTVFKTMSLIEKFNRVMQDVRRFGPNAEKVMHHSVEKVALSYQVFLSHATDKFFKV